LNLHGTYSKFPQIQTFKKIHPVRAELFHADRQTASHDAHRQPAMMKLTDTFRNFANVPNKTTQTNISIPNMQMCACIRMR